MIYHQIVQQIVDGMIVVMAGILIVFTVALVLVHFITNARQERMRRIREQVLRLVSVNAQIDYLKGQIYEIVNTAEKAATLRSIRGIRTHRGLQVLELVSREVDCQQAAVLRDAVADPWFAAYLQKKLRGRNRDMVLLTMKLLGQLQISGYEDDIEQNLRRFPRDTAVQEIGLLALFLQGRQAQIVQLFAEKEFQIVLSFRSLHELFVHYQGEKCAFYQEILSGDCDPYVYKACIRAAGEDGCTALCPLIVQELEAPQLNVLLEAIRTIGRLGYLPATEQIRRLTQHTAWEVRCAAVDALLCLDRAGCYDAILACLYDKEWWVRFHAAEALVTLPCRAQLLADVQASGDQYAQEMLQYIIERDALLAKGVRDGGHINADSAGD